MRVFLSPEQIARDEAICNRDESHYIRNVLRLRPGDEVTACDGRGTFCRAVIAGVWKKGVRLRLSGCRRETPRERGFTIAQAFLKLRAMERAVRQCTELGAEGIVVFNTDRSVVRVRGEKDIRRNVNRMERWAREACRQCGRAHLPTVEIWEGIDRLEEMMARFEAVYLASLTERRITLSASLEQSPPFHKALVIIGPEGDFTSGEESRLRCAGAVPCMLSDAVLRAETAATAAAAIIAQHLLSNPIAE